MRGALPLGRESGLATIAVAGVALTFALLAGTALAKVPPFTIEVTPREPVAGEPFAVVVRTWRDVAHTAPAGLTALTTPTLEGLLSLRSADGARDIPVVLRLEAADRLVGSVTAPSPGTWQLVTFPANRHGWSAVPAGYPDMITLAVRPSSAVPPRGEGGPSLGATALGERGIVIFAAGAALVLLGARALRARITVSRRVVT